VTTVGGAKQLQQGEQSDYSRGSKATTSGGAMNKNNNNKDNK